MDAIPPRGNAKAQAFGVAHSSAKDCDYENELSELIERKQNEHGQVAARIAVGIAFKDAKFPDPLVESTKVRGWIDMAERVARATRRWSDRACAYGPAADAFG